MTLEERIKKMLEESTKQVEQESAVVAAPQVIAEKQDEEIVEVCKEPETTEVEETKTPTIKTSKKLIKESSGVSDQVASLLEAEGLSEEFKIQAVTIFEAAVTDRVLQIQEQMEAEYNEKLDEAKAELETNIDGFLNECVKEWALDNEVAIASNFRSQLAESFMDGIQSLMAEHNIDLPAESEDALQVALNKVNELQEAANETDETVSELLEQINELKSEKILESFKEKMTDTEFDRFTQLCESVKFKDETQYEKQLTVILDNFSTISKKTGTPAQIVEEVQAPVVPAPIVTETFSSVNRYAAYMAKNVK